MVSGYWLLVWQVMDPAIRILFSRNELALSGHWQTKEALACGLWPVRTSFSACGMWILGLPTLFCSSASLRCRYPVIATLNCGIPSISNHHAGSYATAFIQVIPQSQVRFFGQGIPGTVLEQVRTANADAIPPGLEKARLICNTSTRLRSL